MSEIRTKLGTIFVNQAIENDDFYYCNRSKAEKCAQIAENFAIDFAHFLRTKCTVSSDHLFWFYSGEQLLNEKQLLEIYKKTL